MGEHPHRHLYKETVTSLGHRPNKMAAGFICIGPQHRNPSNCFPFRKRNNEILSSPFSCNSSYKLGTIRIGEYCPLIALCTRDPYLLEKNSNSSEADSGYSKKLTKEGIESKTKNFENLPQPNFHTVQIMTLFQPQLFASQDLFDSWPLLARLYILEADQKIDFLARLQKLISSFWGHDWLTYACY